MHESSSFANDHLKLFKKILLLKIGFNALMNTLWFPCCALLAYHAYEHGSVHFHL